MKEEKNERRSFLKHIAAGSAAVTGILTAARPVKAKAGPDKGVENEILYRESKYFKKYYKTLRS